MSLFDDQFTCQFLLESLRFPQRGRQLERRNQSALKHGRRAFLYSAMGELVCSGQLWARAALRQLSSSKVGYREHFPATVW